MKWSSFKYLVKQGWHSMVANRLMTLASIGVLVACLMITGVAALLSVDEVLIPYTADKFSIDGVLAVAQQAKKLTSTRPGLWVRALLTQVRRSDIVTEAEKVLEGMRVEVCRTKIRRTDKVPESTVTLLPLRQYSPGSSACQDYRALASELMEEVQG